MSNSNLVNYTRLSPNYNPRGNNKIRKITIHHVAGVASVEGLGEEFASPARRGSSNYGIGADGRIGLYVEEHNRAWTSGSADNDFQAITIEVSNDSVGGNWHVSDKVLARLIELCVDICKRNNIESINYTGDKNGNLTMHKWFQATACPGPYLESKFPYIADEINKKLEEDKPMTAAERKEFEALKAKVERMDARVAEVEIKYNWTTACPTYYRPTVQKLLDKKYLKGDEKGQLNLTEQMVRTLVILDRAGMFD